MIRKSPQRTFLAILGFALVGCASSKPIMRADIDGALKSQGFASTTPAQPATGSLPSVTVPSGTKIERIDLTIHVPVIGPSNQADVTGTMLLYSSASGQILASALLRDSTKFGARGDMDLLRSYLGVVAPGLSFSKFIEWYARAKLPLSFGLMRQALAKLEGTAQQTPAPPLSATAAFDGWHFIVFLAPDLETVVVEPVSQ
jgi:hypothetical protein